MQLKHFLNKVQVFFNPEKATYWHTITRNTLSSKPDLLGRYYLDFSSKLNYPEQFDNKGIPKYKTPEEPYFYHPIVICQYALGIFEHLQAGGYKDENLKNKYLDQVKWLVNNAQDNGLGKVWYISYDIPEYGLFKPWYSALAQGEAVSVLTRAFLLTENKEYLDLAEEAIKPFNIPVAKGGLLNYFDKIPIYEEYPSPKKTVAVLNGFMFSLFGLYDLTFVKKDTVASQLLYQGINSLKAILKYYDTNYWVRYYLFDHPKEYVASFTYISIMFEQLKALFILSGEPIFKEYAERWESYTKNLLKKNYALLKKIIYARKIT